MRFKLTDNPGAYVPRKRKQQQTHEPPKSFADVENREVFIRAATDVKAIVADCKCYVFGSRLHGTWIESSDYDVVVVGYITPEQIKQIQGLKYDVKVDFRFSADAFMDNKIEIQ